MKNNKAQGALEFLTTYGWAFLVILIMIGALGYFGILNPTRFLPERCSVNTEFKCDEFSLTRAADDEVNMQVVMKNTIGQAIELDETTVKISSDVFNGTTLDNTDSACTFDTTTVSADQSFTMTCVPTGGSVAVTLPSPGSKLKIGFTMSYTPQGKTLAKPISGEVFGALQE